LQKLQADRKWKMARLTTVNVWNFCARQNCYTVVTSNTIIGMHIERQLCHTEQLIGNHSHLASPRATDSQLWSIVIGNNHLSKCLQHRDC